MIPALITFIITVLALACGYLVYQLQQARRNEMSQRRQVQELTKYIHLARWIVKNIHKDDLDQMIDNHTPPVTRDF